MVTQHSRNRPSRKPSDPTSQRLQKVLAAAGIGSRRQCETLISEGRVTVDREVVTRLGTCVDPASQEIRVDDTAIPRTQLVYYLLNKPTGVVSTNQDPEGRVRVIDMIPDEHRLFPIGRLDRSSEGLIIVTNDGEFANLLTHPRYGVEKTYLASVSGRPTHEDLQQLVDGVRLAEGFAKAASARIRKRKHGMTEVQIVLREGRNREIRRLLARIGHKVIRLKRVAIGSIKIEDLPTGAHRKLTRPEIAQLRRNAGVRQKPGVRKKR